MSSFCNFALFAHISGCSFSSAVQSCSSLPAKTAHICSSDDDDHHDDDDGGDERKNGDDYDDDDHDGDDQDNPCAPLQLLNENL